MLTRIGRAPGGSAGLTGLLLTLLAVLVGMLAVVLGLLHHFAQSRPEELRELLAPLAPGLAAAAGAEWLPEAARAFLRQLT